MADMTQFMPKAPVTEWKTTTRQWERLNKTLNQTNVFLSRLTRALEQEYEMKINASFMDELSKLQQKAIDVALTTTVDFGTSNAAANSQQAAAKSAEKSSAAGILPKTVGVIKAMKNFVALGKFEKIKKEDSTKKTDKKIDLKKKDAAQEDDTSKRMKFAFDKVNIAGIFSTMNTLGEKLVGKAATDEDKQQWGEIQGRFDQLLGDAGAGAMASLRPVMDMLQQALESGQLDKLFGFIAGAFVVAAEAVGMLVEGILNLANVIQENWDIVAPILTALATVLLVAIIIQVYQLAVAWLGVYWPILLIFAAIALVVAVLMSLGVSGSTIIGVLAGSFAALGTAIMVMIARAWNLIASFAEFLINIFIDPVYAIRKLFYDILIDQLTFVHTIIKAIETFLGETMIGINRFINGIIESINKVIPVINKLFGTSYGTIDLFDEKNIHAFSDKLNQVIQREQALKPTSDKNVIDVPKMDSRLDIGAAFNKANTGAKEMVDKGVDTFKNFKSTPYKPPQDMPGMSGVPGGNSIPNIGHVGSVGKVNNAVEISSEDLKMMRDLAEMNAIQNFVSLTPTVQVTTGDINSGADLNTIISGISQKLQEEFVSTAEGVYT